MNDGRGSGILGPGGSRIQKPGLPPGAVPVTKIIDDVVAKVLKKIGEEGIVKEMADRIEHIAQMLEKKDDERTN